jgi:hypothetical protein
VRKGSACSRSRDRVPARALALDTFTRQSRQSAGMDSRCGTKEQENAYCCESGRDSEIEASVVVVPHVLNISQDRSPRA